MIDARPGVRLRSGLGSWNHPYNPVASRTSLPRARGAAGTNLEHRVGKRTEMMRRALNGAPKTPPVAARPIPPDAAIGSNRVEPSGGDSAKPTPAILTYRCGHKDALGNVTIQDCPCCRNKKKAAKAMANREKRDAALALLSPGPARARLPVGAAFNAVWDGEKWTGTLTVASVPELCEERTAGGVKPLLRLMRLLDDDYRVLMPVAAAQAETPPSCSTPGTAS